VAIEVLSAGAPPTPLARAIHRESLAGAPAGTTTTYCYRTSLGVRGTTTGPDAIPAGAEIERTVTA